MSTIAAVAVASFAVLGCARRVFVREYRFTIEAVRAGTVQKVVDDLSANGYPVRAESTVSKGVVLGETVSDHVFVLKDNCTDADIARVTRIIADARRDDPIRIRRTVVDQVYASASGEGTASVELRFDLAGDATAYYKKNGRPVVMNRVGDQQSATFLYERSRGEEYVDIYIVPAGEGPDYRPRTFHRISLSFPYEDRVLPWETCWTRFWKWVGRVFGKK